MLKKSDIPSIIKISLTLFIITALAAAILAGVNGVTAPQIAKNELEKQSAAMKKVVPGAENFEKTENEEIFIGKKGEEILGYAVISESQGYGGVISMVVGVDPKGTVLGIDIVSQSETAGLGANCEKDEFKEKFVGKTAGVTVVKGGAKENEIDAISSATITSKAVTEGVNNAIDLVEKYKEGEAK